jgi:hypothetical protein
VVTPAPTKPKKMTVKLPKESPVGENGQPAAKPSWARTPLETPFVYRELKVPEAELTTADPFPDESWRQEIPPTIDVFLPGKVLLLSQAFINILAHSITACLAGY